MRNGEEDGGRPHYSTQSKSFLPRRGKNTRSAKGRGDVNVSVWRAETGRTQVIKGGGPKPKWAAAEGGSSRSEVKAVEGSGRLEKHLRGWGGGDAADWICIFTQLLLVLRLK